MQLIRSLYQFARQRAVRFILWLYTVGVRVRQQPAVWRDRQPRFKSDQLVTPARGDTYAIVVKFAGHGESANLIVLLDALRRSQVNTILVCNGEVPPEELSALSERVHRVLVRHNLGRDFGAYRAVTLQLASEGLRPERLMYFNDSLLYIEGTELDRLMTEFAYSEFDAVGLGENQYQHHLGSFALSLRGDVFLHQRFQRFWQSYKPYDLRKHAIHAGEVSLTAVLKEIGCSIDVVYDAPRLAAKLRDMPMHSLLEATRWLPYGYRRHALMNALGQSFSARSMVLQADATDGKPANEAHAAGQRSARTSTPSLGELRSLRAAGGQVTLLHKVSTPVVTAAESSMAQSADRLSRQVLVDHILEQVTAGSQVHYGFGLFYRLLGCPVVKRDLFARGLYREHDCAEILDNVPAPVRQRLLRELINRGLLEMQAGRWRGWLYRHGML